MAGALEFVFWDVQHGSACYIKTPNDRHIVVDLGIGSYGSNKRFSPLYHLHSNYGVKQLDLAIITHPHRDHLDDIDNLVALNPLSLKRPKYLTRQQLIDGNKKDDSEIVESYLRLSGSYTQTPKPGSSADIYANAQWGGVKISFHASPTCNTNNLNNHSIVSIFEYAGSKIMIPGDNETVSWNVLLENQSFLQAAKNTNILVAPHHGRESGHCSELFDAIGKPNLTIISDGPFCDTSATSNYGNQTRGWLVHYPDGTNEERWCVTTRCDGVIRVKAYTETDNKNYLIVNVQKGSGS